MAQHGRLYLFLLCLVIVLLCRDFFTTNQYSTDSKSEAKEEEKNLALSTQQVEKMAQIQDEKSKTKYDNLLQDTISDIKSRLQSTENLMSEIFQMSKGPRNAEFVGKSGDQDNIGICPIDFFKWKKNKQNISPESAEITHYKQNFCTKTPPKNCSDLDLVGPLAVLEDNVSLDWIYENELKFVHKGGWWSPGDCNPTQSTFIVIPFRKRESQLPFILRQLHPLLKRQKLHYRIFVIEQQDEFTFNRAKLLNVGYREGLKYFPYKCFIMHDVDLIPENDKIDYGCKASPKHLSAAVSTFQYRLPYGAIFGGVSSMWSKHFELINGCSNSFWSWGGEDDNLYSRLGANGLSLKRPSVMVARYKMLHHEKEKKMAPINLGESRKYFKEDGLNSLQYDVISREEKQLFTLVKVNLRKDKDLLFGKFHWEGS